MAIIRVPLQLHPSASQCCSSILEPSIPVAIQGLLSLSDWDTFHATIERIVQTSHQQTRRGRLCRLTLSLAITLTLLVLLLFLAAAQTERSNTVIAVLVVLPILWIVTMSYAMIRLYRQQRTVLHEQLTSACRKMNTPMLVFRFQSNNNKTYLIEIERLGDISESDLYSTQAEESSSSIKNVLDLYGMQDEVVTTMPTADDDSSVTPTTQSRSAQPKPYTDEEDAESLHPPPRTDTIATIDPSVR